MRPLELQSEKYSPTGNIASEGMRNQLGRPRLDRLSILVREAAQNAWDAKSERSAFVTFGIKGWRLSAAQFNVLREVVLPKVPPPKARAETATRDLSEMLRDARVGLERGLPGPVALAVYDRGTIGLGGPTRADEISKGPRDFVDFLRNIGTPPDRDDGGGTFGYGKAALYLASKVHTIIVHTRCMNRERVESRLMVSALTDHYETSEGRFTGRHWWGHRYDSDVVDPVIGAKADEIASALGMPLPAPGRLGTTIVVLDADLTLPGPDCSTRESEPRVVLEHIARRVLWHLWPKMVSWPGENHPRMKFEVAWENDAIPVPDPVKTPPFDAFARALDAARRQAEPGPLTDVIPIECRKPKRSLGTLAIEKFYGVGTDRQWEDSFAPDFVAKGRVHHVALMRRGPELIVKYVAGPPLPEGVMQYAGVYLPLDTEIDKIYAESEPPTHDDWRPEYLADSRHRTFVRVTERRLDEHLDAFAAPPIPPAEEPPLDVAPLAPFTRLLGSLLIGADRGLAPERRPGTKRRQQQRTAPVPRAGVTVEELGMRPSSNGVVREYGVDVRHAKDSRGTRLLALVSAYLVGGAIERADDAPSGAPTPSIVSWTAPNGITVYERQAEVLALGEAGQGRWVLAVDVPRDVAAVVDIRGIPEKKR